MVQQEEWADVGAQMTEELEPVLLRRGSGLLVGPDDSRLPRLQPQACQQRRARKLAALVLELLRLDVDRRLGLLFPRPGLAPAAQRSGGSRVAILLRPVVGALLAQL